MSTPTTHEALEPTTETLHTDLGALIDVLYQQYLEAWGDPDLASVAAAATVNDMITETLMVKTPKLPSDQAA